MALHQRCTVSSLHAGDSSPLAEHGIVAATEFVLGRAVVVICEHADGTIGIGNNVRSRHGSLTEASERALMHALFRVGLMRDKASADPVRNNQRQGRDEVWA
jgi:hypothetical protein